MIATVSLVRINDEVYGHSYLLAHKESERNKPVLVFVHGASGYAEYLSDSMAYFAERGFIAIGPDIMGHGLRAHIDIRGASVLDYVADIRQFIECVVRSRYPGQRIILVGHSMGGLIVQKLGEAGIGHAHILVTPAPPRGVTYVPGKLLIPAFSDVLGTLSMLLTTKPFVPSRELISSFFADPVASVQMIDKWSNTRTTGESLVALREMGMSAIKVAPRSIKVPMLVVGAAKDVVIHRSVAEKIATLHDADFEEIPHLGHMCIFESGWEATALIMEEWLSRVFLVKK